MFISYNSYSYWQEGCIIRIHIHTKQTGLNGRVPWFYYLIIDNDEVMPTTMAIAMVMAMAMTITTMKMNQVAVVTLVKYERYIS